jgi:hypothetical protein
LSVPVPSVVAPFRKVTVPVGVGTPETPVTVAVNVTLEPTAMETEEAVNAVVVDPSVMVTVTALEVEPLSSALPA